MIDRTERLKTVLLEFTLDEARVVRAALHALRNPSAFHSAGESKAAEKLWDAFVGAGIGLDR